MTRLQLLDHARQLGLDIKQNTAKADIRAAIDARAYALQQYRGGKSSAA